jgi:two-component system chemotaxis response regulator CheB
VLSGGLSDGAEGIRAIKCCGGTVLAQDEATADAFAMPRAAIATGAVDTVLPLDSIAAALVQLARRT